MRRILITGSKYWTNRAAIQAVLEKEKTLDPMIVVIHGECEGADVMAGRVAIGSDCYAMPFPANFKLYGDAARFIRDEHLIRDVRIDLVIIFGSDSGYARHLERLAREKRIPVQVIEDTPELAIQVELVKGMAA